jgi:MFS family permease
MAAAAGSLLLLTVPGAGMTASILFGILGMAPAGVIMALAGQAVAPEKRALGMGIFFTLYYAIMTAGPPIAGAIFDAGGSAVGPLILGSILFVAVVPAARAFRLIQTGGHVEALKRGA